MFFFDLKIKWLTSGPSDILDNKSNRILCNTSRTALTSSVISQDITNLCYLLIWELLFLKIKLPYIVNGNISVYSLVIVVFCVWGTCMHVHVCVYVCVHVCVSVCIYVVMTSAVSYSPSTNLRIIDYNRVNLWECKL